MPHVCPTLTQSAGRKGGVKGAKAWHAGLRPSVGTAVNVPAELKNYDAALRGSSSRLKPYCVQNHSRLAGCGLVHQSAWPQGRADYRTSGGCLSPDRLNREHAVLFNPNCLRTWSVSCAVEGAGHLLVHMALPDSQVDPSGCSGVEGSPTRWRCRSCSSQDGQGRQRCLSSNALPGNVAVA